MERVPGAVYVPTVTGRPFVIKMPTYEGKDPCFQEVPWCVACRNKPASELLCCSRCRTAWYCNSECQKAHYKAGHKKLCLEIAQNIKVVEQEAVPLRTARSGLHAEPQNLFETQVTNFRAWDQTRAYMSARWELAESYWQAACEAEVKDVWEKVLFHSLALLRLENYDIITMRYMTPFILLNLQRDDDTFDFIRYWLKLQGAGEEGMAELQRRHVKSQEGEWIYPREKNCRFLDIFEECPDVEEMPLAFLVAVLIVKLRLVAGYDAASWSINYAFRTIGGQHIYEVQDVVKEILTGDSLVNIKSQREQIDRLINAIHRHNPSMIPSIINPNPLLKQLRPPTVIPGDPGEALHVLVFCIRSIVRVPRATELLEQRFGKEPSYNSLIRYAHPY